jgi:hypothetical protein
MTNTTQTRIRIRSSEKTPCRSKKLFRYNDEALQEAAHELLERKHLTDDEIRDFCRGKLSTNTAMDTDDDATNATHLQQAYRARRQEIHELAKLLPSGGARIDHDGRLLAVSENEPFFPPAVPLPPLRDPGDAEQPPNNHNHGIELLDQQEEERRAVADIARAVARYRKAGVADADLQLVRVRPAVVAAPPIRNNHHPQHRRPGPPPAGIAAAVPPPRNNNNTNLTFRRIALAVLAVVAAFLCMLLQTLPLWQTPRQRPLGQIDDLQGAVLHVKHWLPHAAQCGGAALHRTEATSQNDINGRYSWLVRLEMTNPSNKRIHYSIVWNPACRLVLFMWKKFDSTARWIRQIVTAADPPIDCSDGVLHLPSPAVMADQFLASKTIEDIAMWDAFTKGINTTWFMPCHPPSGTQVFSGDCCSAAVKNKGSFHRQRDKNTSESSRLCFRGVHDGLVSERHVEEALRLGAHLIAKGGDHFDIHYDVKILKDRLPSVLITLRNLLRNIYNVTDKRLEVVAFRVNAVGPMDGEGVPRDTHSSNYLLRILNKTRYIRWMKAAERRNELAKVPLPWPFRKIVQPARDTCNLLADLEADPAFAIHTTVFLSEGAGEEYRGGVALYVDYDFESHRRRHHKIRRGISIDGARGRVVVSTGGLENRRCRLPTRAGVRATLQIWWKPSDP